MRTNVACCLTATPSSLPLHLTFRRCLCRFRRNGFCLRGMPHACNHHHRRHHHHQRSALFRRSNRYDCHWTQTQPKYEANVLKHCFTIYFESCWVNHVRACQNFQIGLKNSCKLNKERKNTVKLAYLNAFFFSCALVGILHCLLWWVLISYEQNDKAIIISDISSADWSL